MTKQQLLEKLSFLNEIKEPIGVELYFILKNDEIRYADTSKEVNEDLKKQFINYIKEKFLTELNPDLKFENISEAREHRNTVYLYDHDTWPDELKILQGFSGQNINEFSFKKDKIESIKAFLIKLGNQNQEIVIYKRHHNILLLRKDSALNIIWSGSDSRVEKLESDVLKLNEKFEFMTVNGNLIGLSLKILESHFGYKEIIRQKAQEIVKVIQDSGILESVEGLENLISVNKYAKKVMKIKSGSPVLNAPFDNIKKFINQHPAFTQKCSF